MSKIVFFSIPAHGHTNPTLPVVSELVNKGHEVWYYSFLAFQEEIEQAGAKFISCDEYLPQLQEKELNRKAGKDFAALIEMAVDMAVALDDKVCKELRAFQPDCIVSDSVCLWGKLFAEKLRVAYVCSTTTFAFNQYTAKLMKRGIMEILRMIVSMPRINKKMQLLRSHGYRVDRFVSLIENDNETDTIVYTTKEFQPLAETFSNRYAFVGPSIRCSGEMTDRRKDKKVIYISLGTVLNQNKEFYRNCIKAFTHSDYQIVMSVGEKTDIASLGSLPANFTVKRWVDQIAVLRRADVFITHAGMNSVNESLYYGVPMILFPMHSEQRLVADRVEELGAGIKLQGSKVKHLKKAAAEVLADRTYQEQAKRLSESFRNAGGPSQAANVILAKIEEKS